MILLEGRPFQARSLQISSALGDFHTALKVYQKLSLLPQIERRESKPRHTAVSGERLYDIDAVCGLRKERRDPTYPLKSSWEGNIARRRGVVFHADDCDRCRIAR